MTNSRKSIALTASEFLQQTEAAEHINLIKIDVPVAVLFASPLWSIVKSLDASRLQEDNDFVEALAASENLKQLSWLNLAANPEISYRGVRSISKAVAEKRLPNLEWLDLLGTLCDATPYIDGWSWRMTRDARSLSAEFGAQIWMTLGSHKPEDSSIELLSPVERDLPPDRFKP